MKIKIHEQNYDANKWIHLQKLCENLVQDQESTVAETLQKLKDLKILDPNIFEFIISDGTILIRNRATLFTLITLKPTYT